MDEFTANNAYFVGGFFAGLILLRFVGRWIGFTSPVRGTPAVTPGAPGAPSRPKVILLASLTNPLPWFLLLGFGLLPLGTGLVPASTRWYWSALGLVFAIGASLLAVYLQRRRRLSNERAKEAR